ncbi:MAG: nucleotidyltransferase domain-containing protein [Oscillospiraceae bacterium]|nr:nucleotidyltransferase domain-containing protein [Oscillospiraceae bacterium]
MAADIEPVRAVAKSYADEVRRVLPVEKAVLFGSYAKGTATKSSDVDIAFFFRDYGGKTRFDMGLLLLKLCRDYKVYFEPLAFEASDIDRDNPFINEILRTGLEI